MKAFLFDIDGTLIKSGGAGRKSFDLVFKEFYAINDAMDGIIPHGKTDPAIAREIFMKKLRREPSYEELKLVLDRYIYHLRVIIRTVGGYRVLPGVRELLEELKKRNDVIIGLATGNLRDGARLKLLRGELWDYFKIGAFSSDSEDRVKIVIKAKEKAEEFANSLGKRLGEVYVVGDTPYDIISAKKAGVKSIAIATSIYSLETLRNFAPDILLRDLQDIREFLKVTGLL